ncbi:MAG TPA: ribosome biogenesis GTPase Der [Amaricoccus sp.]|jgi:GTP-binding protein|nr:ribosome biogenesis GTPase Der [Amaricoccus sp.]
MSFTLAIVGRPNVGKSTLFNRLVGRRLALVDDRPGVTRDLREGAGRLGALRFTVVDTAGLEQATDESLPGRMRALTERAIAGADVCLFMIDARAGVTPADRTLAELLRKRAANVLLVANKAEGRAAEAGLIEAWELGLGEPLAVSAEHGIGMDDLLRALTPLAEGFADAVQEVEVEEEVDDSVDEEGQGPALPVGRPIQIAVVGRPNAGKSTLVNAILGEDRLLTGPEAGITRDAIAVDVDWMGTPFRIFDTAGMRRKAKVQEKLEKLGVSDGLRAVRFAEVVVVLLDVQVPFESQDLRLADLAEREGRAVVVAVNKWDLEAEKPQKLSALREAFGRLLPQLRGAPMVMVSALTGSGLDRLHDAVVRAYAVWNTRISTARLNRWLGAQTAEHPPPAPGGRRIRMRYMTQVKTRPPTFVLFASIPDAVPEDYRRFLVNGLRRDFDMPGATIRLLLRSGDNPYAGRRKPNVTALDKHRPRRLEG